MLGLGWLKFWKKFWEFWESFDSFVKLLFLKVFLLKLGW